jgi:hypothetical protein
MRTNLTAKAYGNLTPEERFRLVLAAMGRGDQPEADRLAAAGGRILLSFQEHSPHMQAFLELGTLMFIELLDLAASYNHAFGSCDSYDLHLAACGRLDVLVDEEDEGPAEPGEGKKPDGLVVREGPTDDDGIDAVRERMLQAALAFGFQLRTKADGWRLFCERLSVPPFLVLVMLPGFDRLQVALNLAEKAAFVPEGMARWMNSHRPAGVPELTAGMMMTPEKIAAELEEGFRRLVAHRSGEGNST